MIGFGKLLNNKRALPQPSTSPSEPLPTTLIDPEPAPKEPQAPADDSHEAAGRRNEVIRSQLAEIAHNFAFLTRLNNTASNLQSSVGQFLDDYEKARLDVASTRKELAAEREHGANLERDLAKAQDEVQTLNQERPGLESTIQRLELKIRAIESDLTTAHESGNVRDAKINEFEVQLSQERAKAEQLNDEIASYRDRFEASQTTASEFEQALRKEAQQVSILTQEQNALKASLDDLGRKLAKRERELSEANAAHEAAKAKLGEFENASAQTGAAHASQIKDLAEKLEHHQVQTASLEAKLEALGSRAQITEQLLAQARDQLRAKTDELSASERTLLKVTLERNALERRTTELKRECDRIQALARETNDINTKLAERSHLLVANFKSKEREQDATQQRLAALTEDLAALRTLLHANEQRFDARVAELNAQLEQEKGGRLLAEGSLDIARKTVEDLRRELSHMRRQAKKAVPLVYEDGTVVEPPEAQTGSSATERSNVINVPLLRSAGE